MSWRTRAAAGAACVAGVVLAAVRGPAADDPKKDAVAPPVARVLPGLHKDGFVQLPNQWKLSPVGRQIEVGDLPVNIQLHPTGQFAAVLHCGMKDHEVVVPDLNPAHRRIVSRAVADQAPYGPV